MNLSSVRMGILQILLLICEAVLLTDCARGPPQVADQVAHRQSARLGSAIKLPCPVDGDPPPLIMWTKDGRNIHSGWTRFRILRLGLKIKEVEAEDAGTYVCKATNGFGSVNINYTLIVIVTCVVKERPPQACDDESDHVILRHGNILDFRLFGSRFVPPRCAPEPD
ncbi:unnamed protein product [Boreogadus saida]